MGARCACVSCNTDVARAHHACALCAIADGSEFYLYGFDQARARFKQTTRARVRERARSRMLASTCSSSLRAACCRARLCAHAHAVLDPPWPRLDRNAHGASRDIDLDRSRSSAHMNSLARRERPRPRGSGSSPRASALAPARPQGRRRAARWLTNCAVRSPSDESIATSKYQSVTNG